MHNAIYHALKKRKEIGEYESELNASLSNIGMNDTERTSQASPITGSARGLASALLPTTTA